MTLMQTAQIAIVVGAFSFTASCTAAPPAATTPAEPMKAIVYAEYGTADVLRLAAIDRPMPTGKQVLVRIRAAAANPVDWHYMRGTPYLMRMQSGLRAPESPRLGTDLAGVVVAVGPEVTKFKVGDAVFGVGPGAFAEYSLAAERRLALKPASISFEDAAAVPVAAITALQGLRDHGKVQAGQKILINGASGGVGTYMVQLAKVLGAEVTAVCSARNADLVRSLGADHVVDYTQQDFTTRPERYDVILDNVGNHSLSKLRSVLRPTGTLVGIGGGGPDNHVWGFGFVGGMLQRKIVQSFTDQRLASFMAEVLTADLEYIAGLIAQGRVRSVIDRRYSLAETPDAIRYLETGRARGKVIINVE